MSFTYEYPHVDMQDVNVDWFLHEFKKLLADWKIVKAAWNEILSEWSGLQDDWEKYQTELNQKFQDFTTNITNEFGAIKLEFTNIQDEFKALKIYVDSQVSSIPEQVLNIFNQYVTDGTIGEIIDTEILDNLKSQVQTNTTDISGLKTQVNMHNHTLGQHTTKLENLTNSVNANTTEIINLKTKVQTNTTDITANAGNIAKNTLDIGNLQLKDNDQDLKINANTTKNTQQDERITALENRPSGDLNFCWFIADSHFAKFEGACVNSAYLKKVGYHVSATRGDLAATTAEMFSTINPAVDKTTVGNVFIVMGANVDNMTNDTVKNALVALADKCLQNIPQAHVYVAAVGNLAHSIPVRLFNNAAGKINSNLNLMNGNFHLLNDTWQMCIQVGALVNNTFSTDLWYYRYINSLLQSAQGINIKNYPWNNYFESAITPTIPNIDTGASECWVSVSAHVFYIIYTLKFIATTLSSSLQSFSGGTWTNIGNIPSSANNAISVPFSMDAIVNLFDRNNTDRSFQTHACQVQFVENQMDGWDLNIKLIDINESVKVYYEVLTLETSTSRFYL